MPYTPYNADWQDAPSTATPITAAALEHIELGISTAQTTAEGKVDAEQARDTLATALVAGANVTITPNDAANTITIAASGGGGGGTSLVIDPTTYGAIGNGVNNDTTALTNAINALTPGMTLWIAPGKIYTHTTVQTVTANGVKITGGGEIRATAEATSAFIISGNYVTVDNVTFSCPTTTVRGETLENQKLVLNGCVGAYLHKVTVSGSAAAGMFIYGASWYHIDSCYVQNTRADAYHNVKGSHHGIISNCEALNVGDDGFAVVSYATGGDAGTTHHIRVSDCKVTNSTKGRMFSCAGGEDVEFTDCFGDGSYAAGIIASTEPAYASPGVARVIFRNIEIRRANTLVGPAGAPARPNHGAILVSAARDGTLITDVAIRNIRIVDTDTAVATRQISIDTAGTGDVSNLVFENIKVFGTGPATFFTSTVGASKYQMIDTKPDGSSWGWELLGRYSAPGGTVTSGAITVGLRDELMIVVRGMGTSGGADVLALRFNADAGNNYWSRYITSAAGGATLANVETVNTNMARLTGNSSAAPRAITATINNFTAWEKVGSVVTATSAGGAGTAGPADVFGAIQWANTTGRITSVELRTVGGVATLNAGTGMLIFGRNFTA